MTEENAVPLEFAEVVFTVKTATDGTYLIYMEGNWIDSLPGINFGFALKPETTEDEAQALCDLLTKHNNLFFAGFLNRIDDAEFQRHLTEVYDDMGYFDPTRPKGPGDFITKEKKN